MVDSLEDHRIDMSSLIIFECYMHLLVSISKSLDTDADWSMAHVRVLGLFDRIVIPVNYSIKIPGNTLGDFVEEFVIKFFGILVGELG